MDGVAESLNEVKMIRAVTIFVCSVIFAGNALVPISFFTMLLPSRLLLQVN